jgi:hypothetical protein
MDYFVTKTKILSQNDMISSQKYTTPIFGATFAMFENEKLIINKT